MKKKTINLFLLIILTCQYLNAQSDYKAGYIITTNKDTINGFILNKIDSELANKINFKKNSSEITTTEYTTSELLGFGFGSGRLFKRMRINSKNLTTQDTTFVFAKRIVEGKIDLYVWRHKKHNSKDLFIVNNQSERQAHLTKPKKTEIKSDGKTYSKKDNKYKNYLFYIKNDKNIESKTYNKLRYGEKSISKNITLFNSSFKDKYPIMKYKEPFKYNYDVLAGIPFNLNSDELHFRVGVYRNKTFVEKSNKFSYLSGIIYHHWNEDKIEDYQSKNATVNYRWQMLNIIPVGIKFQANSKRIIPYYYIGVGLAVLMMTDYIIEDYENVGSQKEFVFLPTINIGVGVKIKVNSNFILAEITPTMNGIFFNVGYSF